MAPKTNYASFYSYSKCCIVLQPHSWVQLTINVFKMNVHSSATQWLMCPFKSINLTFPSCRHKPPRPHQCPCGGVRHLGQCVLGGGLWRRLPTDILSLVRPCVSHPSMLCFLLFLLPILPLLFLTLSFPGLCSEQLWERRDGNTWRSSVSEFSSLISGEVLKKAVATKLNMTQSSLSYCCCFADAWLGKRPGLHFSLITVLKIWWYCRYHSLPSYT